MKPPRTKANSVIDILGDNYDGKADVNPFIEFASAMTDQAIVIAGRAGLGLDSVMAELVERALAAMCYCRADPQYQAENTGAAGGTFLGGGSTLDGEPDRYKRMAIEVDWTGSVNKLLNRKSAGSLWLGKIPSQQIPIWQRI